MTRPNPFANQRPLTGKDPMTQAHRAQDPSAKTPSALPAKGWIDVLWRVKAGMAKDHVGLIAAGVAFYALLAIFPTITALMALAGLVLDPADIADQLETFAAVMPDAAAQIVLDQAVGVAGAQSGGLGFAFAISMVLALYSASKGVASLVEGLNIAYSETESRGFLALLARNLALTLLMVLALITGLGATLAAPMALTWLPLSEGARTAVGAIRWAVLAAGAVIGLAALYRWGPDRTNPKWRWLTPGALTSTALWLIASIGFAAYVSNFSSYNESFGSVAGIIILLTWLWLSAYIVLLGAVLNAEIEAQTGRDTKTGETLPAKTRG